LELCRGKESIAAAAVANVFFQTLQHPIFGCATALDTLLSQSHGARRPDLFGQWTQIGLIILLLLTFPFMGMLAFAEPILLSTGMNATLASRAAAFDRALIPGVPPLVAFVALTKHLQSQHILAPSVWIAAIANVINVAANYLLIFECGMGLRGAPLATSLSRWCQLGMMCTYLVRARRRLGPALPPLGIEWRAIPHRARRFIALGAPGALMLGLEAWAFEASTFLAAFLGTVSLDAHIILLNLISFTFLSGPFALGIAASIRIGQLVGAGEPARARAAAAVTVAVVFIVMLTLAALMVLFRSVLGRLFTEDAEVVAKTASLVGVAALFQLSDGMQAAIAAILRGLGQQRTVAALNFLGLWLVGLSLGALLTFPAGMGVVGLWWGLAAGLTAVALVGLPLVARTDWHTEARAARERVEATSTSTLGLASADAQRLGVPAGVWGVEVGEAASHIAGQGGSMKQTVV